MQEIWKWKNVSKQYNCDCTYHNFQRIILISFCTHILWFGKHIVLEVKKIIIYIRKKKKNFKKIRD